MIRCAHPEELRELFGDWQETLIWSCLQGVMGDIYVKEENAKSAFAFLGDFGYLAGEPDEEVIQGMDQLLGKRFYIVVPQNEAWYPLLEKHFGERAFPRDRYAIKKEPDVWDLEKLQKVVDELPRKYTLKAFDQKTFDIAKKTEWMHDFVGQFEDFAEYAKRGIGFVICHDHQPVAGISSYSVYNEGVEIEIITREDYRRRGLAYVCASKMIIECVARNLYPSWDAQNKWSVALARKLGYHYEGTYRAYEING